MNYHLLRLTRIAIGERCTGVLMALDDMVAELTGEVGFVTNRLSRSIGDRWHPVGPARSPGKQVAPGAVDLAPEEAEARHESSQSS